METLYKQHFGDQFAELYCDLDGVLYDFIAGALAITGIDGNATAGDKKLKSDFWKRIGGHCKRGGKFFENLPLMPDATVLWKYISGHFPTILTATGHIGDAKEGKRIAVGRDFGYDVANRMILVRTSNDKAKYAKPHHVLIDDKRKSIDPWIEAGGIGILHKNAEDTIKQLRLLGL